jgi:predicted TIM-barrel fold metal-dependent hydrolase
MPLPSNWSERFVITVSMERSSMVISRAVISMTSCFGLLLQVGVDRIMFSADYPYASMAQARAFLDQLPVSTANRERIAHGNAERLFGL